MNHADELFEVPPEMFVAARDRLAKQLKKDDPGESKRIAMLRRPSRSVWALNHLARRQPDLISAVLAAGADLRRALEKAAVDRSAWREAQAVERSAVDAAVDAASRALGGAKEADRRRMAETLRAAIIDPEVAGGLNRGVLTEDAMTTGLGMVGMTFTAAAPGESAGTPHAKLERDRRARRAKQEAEAKRSRRHAEQLQAAAERAARAADDARRAAEEAETDAAAAEQRLRASQE